jgi:hypothetical protein
MKRKTFLVVFCGVLGLLSLLNHAISWGQTNDVKARTMTIAGPVASIRLLGNNVAFELGGPWRRRFAAVMDRTDLLAPLHETSNQYLGRTIRVTGPVYENRGRYEIQMMDLSQMILLDGDADVDTEAVEADATHWLDVADLAREIKKLRRDIASLKQEQVQQQEALAQLQASAPRKVENRYYSGSNYGELERRINRIELALNAYLKVTK